MIKMQKKTVSGENAEPISGKIGNFLDLPNGLRK